jgi:hypothetical protein
MVVAFSPLSVTIMLCPSIRVIPLDWSFSVRFPLSVAFIIAVVTPSVGIIDLLPTYDTSVGFIDWFEACYSIFSS